MVRIQVCVQWVALLVCLSSLSALTPITEASQSRHTPSVSIQGFSFDPSSNLTVHSGDTVTWTNNDGAAHTATSTSGPASFDSGTILGGGTFDFTFTTMGTYDYRCDFHTSMTATLTVVGPDSNNAPEVSAVALSPDPVFTNDIISVSATTSDADGDPVTLSYSWIKNGNFISETGNTLAGSSWFDKGDEIQVEVTPNDGNVNGNTTISSVITISNSPPTISSATISPPTLNNETIAVCSASGWNDADGDAESHQYEWRVNGVVQQDTAESSGPFNADDVVSCTATPNDGEDIGLPQSSQDLTVVAVDAPDADSDGVPDETDSCPNTVIGETVDGDGCALSQLDEDDDEVSDADDLCPGTPTGANVDNDGCGSSQLDSDGDGFTDDIDAFPVDENEHIDSDDDGTGDNADNDDDNDSWNDTAEIDCGTNSTNVNSTPLDTDSDWICDVLDSDDDHDGWNDTTETDCGTNSTDWNSVPSDTDGDGICDMLDDINDNLPPPGYEFGNNTEEENPVTEPEPDLDDERNDGIPGFTSILMITSLVGALMYLNRRCINY